MACRNRSRKSRRKSRKSRKSRGGSLVGALKTALLPFLLYKGQKAQQKRVIRKKTMKRKKSRKAKKSRRRR